MLVTDECKRKNMLLNVLSQKFLQIESKILVKFL